jgi:hypothetical protein
MGDSKEYTPSGAIHDAELRGMEKLTEGMRTYEKQREDLQEGEVVPDKRWRFCVNPPSMLRSWSLPM